MRRLLCIAVWIFFSDNLISQERFIVGLRNGMRLGPGMLESTDSVSTNLFQKTAASEAGGGSIFKLDDGWRRTYFNGTPRNVIERSVDNQIPFEPIRFPAYSEVDRTGNRLRSARISRIEEFKPTGRRSLTVMKGNDESINVLQQITELTPEYVRLELLRGDKLSWDSREALTSIPSNQLQAILEHQLDLTKPSEWIRMFEFYMRANRFSEAIEVLTEGIRRFPDELGQRKNLIAQANQLQANKQFEEINIRREAGQIKLANQLLRIMPPNLLETQISAKNQLDQVRQDLELIQQITTSLKERVSKLPQTDQQAIQPVLDELLKDEINIETAARLDDYIRLSGNSSSVNENMVALAVGGWILGPGSGIQNFAVAKSLVNVRKLVKDYLAESSQPRRELILNQLRSEEGGQPQYVAKVLTTMKPPLPLPAAGDKDPSGFFRQQVKLSNGDAVEYTVQLPPEYDPNRKYSCIVALPGTRFHHQVNIPIDYWCGSVIDREGLEPQRFGAATRFGYVVISPNWMTEKQGLYQYTESEKLRVLVCYRDALRRISINTDKVFITGHFEGATAAWDIAQSHPDMWAGAVMLSPTAEKFIVHYTDNIKAQSEAPEQIPLATYIVYGELDSKLERYVGITSTADRYLKNNFYDSMLVEHIGQEAGLFPAEIPRIFQWMQLSSHQRIRTLKYINCVSMRSGDRLFYWLEAPRLSNDSLTNSFQFDHSRQGRFEAAILDSSQNSIRVSKIPSQDRTARIWLTPEMVDFGREVTVIVRDKRTNRSVSGKIEVMLEDVRTRGDRLHFFWDLIDTTK
jgi:tetratricopeptide (TPR) repeat protein